jgi:hypothetical protein
VTIDRPAAWRTQLALERKAFDHAGKLIEVPCKDPDGLASCYAVRYSGGGAELVFAAAAPEWFVDRALQIEIERYFTATDQSRRN